MTMAWIRSWAPSFISTRDTWVLTVASPIMISAAIALLKRPAATCHISMTPGSNTEDHRMRLWPASWSLTV